MAVWVLAVMPNLPLSSCEGKGPNFNTANLALVAVYVSLGGLLFLRSIV